MNPRRRRRLGIALTLALVWIAGGTAQEPIVERAIRMGVKIAVGTDAGVGEHALNAKAFTTLVKYGMEPMDAIVAGTSGAAMLIGQDEQFGSVEPGKFADLVAVAGALLQNTQVLE